MAGFSGVLQLTDLDDFITPSQVISKSVFILTKLPTELMKISSFQFLNIMYLWKNVEKPRSF